MSNAAYGLLGAPLAMAALPLFVQLPAYYATHVGVALAPLGGVLFAARLLDMLQDRCSATCSTARNTSAAGWRSARPPGAGVCRPVAAAAGAPGAWLALMLVLAYGAHSLNIACRGARLRAPRSRGAKAWDWPACWLPAWFRPPSCRRQRASTATPCRLQRRFRTAAVAGDAGPAAPRTAPGMATPPTGATPCAK
jgi:hypothetical protein